MLPYRNLFWPTMMLAAVLGSQASSQESSNPFSCSAHFQARANWLETLGGHPDAVDLMTVRAETLWYSVPKDCMFTMFGHQGCKYDPRRLAVSDVMTKWAEASQGYEPLPTCMEDSFCSACLSLFEKVAFGRALRRRIAPGQPPRRKK